MLTTTALVAAIAVALGLAVDRYADLRAAAIEARFPPQGRFVTVGGREVHVVVKGSGPDLVLIHGAGGNARDFTFSLVDRLADRYRVFVVDRPGLGWSDRVAPLATRALGTEAETPAEQARHLAAAVRALGAERPIVLGHSYGGAVAMAWALDEPAAAAVILSGATMPWPGDLDIFYRVLGSRAGGFLAAPLINAFVSEDRIVNATDGVFDPQPAPEGYVAGAAVPLAIRAETLRVNARQVMSLRPQVVEMSRRYGEVDIPVEILHGTADETVYASIHAEPLAALLPDAHLTLLQGIGHAPHHSTPAAVVEAIDRAAARAGLR